MIWMRRLLRSTERHAAEGGDPGRCFCETLAPPPINPPPKLPSYAYLRASAAPQGRSYDRHPAGDSAMFSEITRFIRVTVKPFFLEDESPPSKNHYVGAYEVSIENRGGKTVQLRHRHWRITDGMG